MCTGVSQQGCKDSRAVEGEGRAGAALATSTWSSPPAWAGRRKSFPCTRGNYLCYSSGYRFLSPGSSSNLCNPKPSCSLQLGLALGFLWPFPVSHGEAAGCHAGTFVFKILVHPRLTGESGVHPPLAPPTCSLQLLPCCRSIPLPSAPAPCHCFSAKSVGFYSSVICLFFS